MIARRGLPALLVLVGVGAAWAGVNPAAPAPGREAVSEASPARGRYLVATRQIRGSLFARSVVFLTDYGPGRAMGLIVNRPTDTALAEIFPGASGRAGSLHIGGPVKRHEMMVLLRSAEPPERSERIAGDIWLTGHEPTLRAAAGEPDADRNLRVFAGYAGWTAGQLDAEVERGDWLVLELPVGTLFDAPAGTLWETLFERNRKLIARPGGTTAAQEVRAPSDRG